MNNHGVVDTESNDQLTNAEVVISAAAGSTLASSVASYPAVYISNVAIRNFRGIRECSIELEPSLTLLVGKNNAGKSRVLSAIHLALGGRVADADDFSIGHSAEPEIDVIMSPLPAILEDGEESFEDTVGRRVGDGAQLVNDDPFRERFAWRTHVFHSGEGLGARVERRTLTFDSALGSWIERSDAPELTREQYQLAASDYIDTGRDITRELSQRGSGVRRVLSELGISVTDRQELESQMLEISEQVLAKSETLGYVHASLAELNTVVGGLGKPSIRPLPGSIDELSRIVSIELDGGAGPMPIRLHGAGARSLASIQLQSVLYDRVLGADGGSLRPHPVTLVEEPEAHLHPQAASEIPMLLGSVRGQVVASTHSAQVATAAPPLAIRLLRAENSSHVVVDLGPGQEDSLTPRALRPSKHTEEMEKLKRLVERPFGDLLFASAIVIGDGATERGMLPPLLRHALGTKAHGVVVIDPDSMENSITIAAVRFARLIGIPWYIFADADDSGSRAVESLVTATSEPNAVIWVGKPDAAAIHGVSGATEAMLVDFDSELVERACIEVRPGINVRNVLFAAKSVKGFVGPSYAARIIAKYNDYRAWPEPLRNLIDAVREGSR